MKTITLSSADRHLLAEEAAELVVQKMDKVLNLEQMAQKMGRTTTAVKKLVQRGKLPCYRFDNKSLYFSDLETTRYLLGR